MYTSTTFVMVAESARNPACKCVTHCRVSGICEVASASNPVNNSMLPKGLRISCASTVATSASAFERRAVSRSPASRFCSVKSRTIQIVSPISFVFSLTFARNMPIVRLRPFSAITDSCSEKKTVRRNLGNQARKSRRQPRLLSRNPVRRHLKQLPRFRIDNLQNAVGRNDEHPARQVFQHSRKVGSHARVFLQASLQFRIRTLQFPVQPRDLPLQLRVRFLQGAGRLRERQERSRQTFLRCFAPFHFQHGTARSLPGSRQVWHHRSRCTLSARILFSGLNFS